VIQSPPEIKESEWRRRDGDEQCVVQQPAGEEKPNSEHRRTRELL
jgi:hypothetical protein